MSTAPDRLRLSTQMDGRRYSPRSIPRKLARENVRTPSESSTSRRTSRSNTLRTPTPSVSSMRPKLRKITDYMSVITDHAQPGNGGGTQRSNDTRFPANGFITPTEDSFTSNTNGAPISSPSKLPQDSAPSPLSLNLGALNISNYPWNNNPIAVAIWVAQKIENAKTIISPAPSSSLPSRRPSQATISQKSGSPLYPDEIRSRAGERLPTTDPRTSRKQKQLDHVSSKESSVEPRADMLETPRWSRPDAEDSGNEMDASCPSPFKRLMRQQAQKVAPKIKALKPFAPGFGDAYFDSKAKQATGISKDTVAAGKLLFNVLPALLTPKWSPNCQGAADALIRLLDEESSSSPRCLEALDIMSQDSEILLAARIITTQVCASELLFDFDGAIEGAGEHHVNSNSNNNQSPNPNFIDDINTALSTIVSKTNNQSNTSLLEDSRPAPPALDGASRRPSTSLSPSRHSSFSSSLLLSHNTSHLTSPKTPRETLNNNNTSFSNPREKRISKMVRTSNRTRKPTARALEAAASRAPVRKRTPKGAPAVPAVKNGPAELNLSGQTETQLLAAQLLELATAAVAPGFIPEVEVDVAELERQFYANLASEPATGGEVKGRATVDDPPQGGGSGAARSPVVLDHPAMDRPWTDDDGWTHTGKLNEHGEEVVLVPNTYVWYRPTNTFNSPRLPPPRPRMKSVQQIEKDNLFGFPPLLGQRNVPHSAPLRPAVTPSKRSHQDMDESTTADPDVIEGRPKKRARAAKKAESAPARASTRVTRSHKPAP